MAKLEGIRVELVGKQIKEFEDNVWLTEHLRYAGFVTRPQVDYGATSADPENTHKYFVMIAPRGVMIKAWCEMQIGRLASFGIKATEYRQ